MSDADDPLARVKAEVAAAGGAAAPAKSVRATGDHVAPVPPGAPEVNFRHKHHGEPTREPWVYRDEAGRVLFYVVRFARAKEGEAELPPSAWTGKEVLPRTLWRDGGRTFWAWKGYPAPRPLYGLQKLALRPAAPVLIVEGEKAADAAAARFVEFVVVTWPGGSKALGGNLVDFSPLAGRHVVVWPDADEPGVKAAATVTRAAILAGAASAGLVELPPGLPKGWDLADDWPDGFTPRDAAQLVEAAREGAAPAGVEWPLSIRLDAGAGLFYDEWKDGGAVPHWLCAPFEVLGEARAPDGLGWAVVLRFRDRDGRERTVPIPRASLASGGGDARAALADAGLVFDTARGKMDRFSSALMRVKSDRRITLVTATGWCGERFVLPHRTIGPAGGEPVLFTGEAPSLNYGTAGHFDDWQREIAEIADGNTALTFALSVALAAPLVRPLGGEGGGFHFRGNSSTGKSTLLVAAGSVWGGGSGEHGFGHTWRSTANALENLARAHNDTLLCLDEFAQVDPSEAGVAAYALANGQGKARLKSDGSLRRQAEWLLLFLSSGELSLADHMASASKGGRVAAGQELRLVDVPAEAGGGMGIWERLHGFAGPAQLSEAVSRAAKSHFGFAGPMFLERFTADRTEAVRASRELLAGFLATAHREGDSGQVRRVGRRFAIVAAAGELAIEWGLLPLEPGAAASAALVLYRRWADAFGRDAPREVRDVLRRLREVIQSEKSAFAPVGDHDVGEETEASTGGRDGEARGLRTYGFRQVLGPNIRYLFHDAGWAYVFRGLDLADAARAVAAAGYLETDGDGQRHKKSVKIRGERQRLYCVNGSILEAHLGD